VSVKLGALQRPVELPAHGLDKRTMTYRRIYGGLQHPWTVDGVERLRREGFGDRAWAAGWRSRG
jgi:hypothetical protein